MEQTLEFGEPLAVAVVAALRAGDVHDLRRHLGEHPGLTPLEAALRAQAYELVAWLRAQGAKTGAELG